MVSQFTGLEFLPTKGVSLLHRMVAWCKIRYVGKQKNATASKTSDFKQSRVFVFT